MFYFIFLFLFVVSNFSQFCVVA